MLETVMLLPDVENRSGSVKNISCMKKTIYLDTKWLTAILKKDGERNRSIVTGENLQLGAFRTEL